MAERQHNPLFTRSEKRRVRHKIRHKIKGAARRGFGRLFGIPLSPGLGGKASRHTAHRHSPAGGPQTRSLSSTVRGDVIEALRGQGYSRAAAEKMAPRAESGDTFESLFRRSMQRNPGELIIFGNPAIAYTRKGIQRAKRAGNPIPLAILQGLGFGAGEIAAGDVFGGKRSRAKNTHRHNAGCGENFCFHGAYKEKAKAADKEAHTTGAFIRNLRFGAGDYRWTVLTPRKKNVLPEAFTALPTAVVEGLGIAVGEEVGGRAIRRRLKKRGRKNPDAVDKAGDLFERFHHRAGAEYETQASAKRRKVYTILGPLVAIGINPQKYDQVKRAAGSKAWEEYKVDHWDRLPHLAFLTGPQVGHVKRIIEQPDEYVKNCPQLASSPNGKQLYAITPDGAEIDLRQFDTDTTKDFVDLGEATFVVYVAKKPDDAVEWVHELGEEGGARPRLMFDRLKREIFFIGGSYTVEAPGILN